MDYSKCSDSRRCYMKFEGEENAETIEVVPDLDASFGVDEIGSPENSSPDVSGSSFLASCMTPSFSSIITPSQASISSGMTHNANKIRESLKAGGLVQLDELMEDLFSGDPLSSGDEQDTEDDEMEENPHLFLSSGEEEFELRSKGEWNVLETYTSDEDFKNVGEDNDIETIPGTSRPLLRDNPVQRLPRKAHSVNHVGKRILYCLECGKSFTRPSVLKTHAMTHTGEKPFTCLECGRSFSRSTHLKTHAMTHTGEKPFCCLQCGKNFINSSNLKAHLRIHTGEKPFHCLECGKSFSESSTLKKHLRTHTGERPFSCLVCGKSYRENNSLKKHKRIHKEE